MVVRWEGEVATYATSAGILLRPEAQRHVLDAHAGLLEKARQVGDAYREWHKLARARVDHEANAAARNAARLVKDAEMTLVKYGAK